jgi:hypothetical protein
MKNETEVENLANRIADAIVELVERTNGPVTLLELEREIPGFATKEARKWDYTVGPKMLIWDGMTEAGCAALHQVMSARRVAIQFVNRQPYILEGCTITDETWRPIVLLPARAANLDSPTWLLRASPAYQDFSVKKAAAEGITGYRPLTPCPVRFTADQFSI